MQKVNVVGCKFGRLLVLSEAPNQGRYRAVLCRCDCGVEKVILVSNLRTGKIISCGCYRREASSFANSTHGKSGTRIFTIWTNMLSRCFSKENRSYRNYGGRGISVCDKWLSFSGFYEDMGDPPGEGMSLERIDVNGDYCKENCVWATVKQQARNKRNTLIVEYLGVSLPLIEHCERLGLKYKTVHRRIRKGWSAEKALSTPIITPLKGEQKQ